MATNTGQSPATFSFFELLDRTFRMYRENFRTYITMTAIVIIPTTIISVLLSLFSASSFSTTSSALNRPTSSSTALLGAVGILGLLSGLIAYVTFVINDATLTYAASENYLGRQTTFADAFRATRQRFSSLGCGFIIYGIVLAVFGVAVTIIGALCWPAFAAFGLVAYIGIATYAFLVPVLVLENVNISAGVNRAWNLGKSRFWTGLALVFVLTFITELISIAFTLILQLVVVGMRAGQPNALVVVQVISVLLASLISIFLRPIIPIGLTLFYYDTRNRQEGLDFMLQASGIPDARPFDLPSPVPQTALTSRDLINVGILVAVSLGLGLLANSVIQGLINTFRAGPRNF